MNICLLRHNLYKSSWSLQMSILLFCIYLYIALKWFVFPFSCEAGTASQDKKRLTEAEWVVQQVSDIILTIPFESFLEVNGNKKCNGVKS